MKISQHKYLLKHYYNEKVENINAKMKGLVYSIRESFIDIKNDVVEEYLLALEKLSSYIFK